MMFLEKSVVRASIEDVDSFLGESVSRSLVPRHAEPPLPKMNSRLKALVDAKMPECTTTLYIDYYNKVIILGLSDNIMGLYENPVLTHLCRCFFRSSELRSADLEGFTALHLAASSGSASMCALLLNLNAPVDIRDQQGRTALGEMMG